MNFHEKSAWACLSAIVLAFVPYFFVVFRHPWAFVGLFFVAVAFNVLILVAFHALNAIVSNSIRKRGEAPPLDELDRAIELRAARLSGVALAVIVLTWSIAAMFGVLSGGVAELSRVSDAVPSVIDVSISGSRVLTWIHALFAGFVVANVIYYGKIVVDYRSLCRE